MVGGQHATKREIMGEHTKLTRACAARPCEEGENDTHLMLVRLDESLQMLRTSVHPPKHDHHSWCIFIQRRCYPSRCSTSAAGTIAVAAAVESWRSGVVVSAREVVDVVTEASLVHLLWDEDLTRVDERMSSERRGVKERTRGAATGSINSRVAHN